MDLTLSNLQASGGFSGGLVKEQIEWSHNGQDYTATVYVRPLSYFDSMAGAGADVKLEDLLIKRVAKCICHEDGSPVFREQDITGVKEDGTPVMIKDDQGHKVERGPLNSNLSRALLEVVAKVSGLGK